MEAPREYQIIPAVNPLVVLVDGSAIVNTSGQAILFYTEKDAQAVIDERRFMETHVVRYPPLGDIYSKRKTEPYTGAPAIPVKKKKRWWRRGDR